jgi:ABC-2 type transport system permease protein
MRYAVVRTEATAEVQSFLRQRAAVFFTFGFPLLVVALVGTLVAGGAGPFDHPQSYYLPGYLGFLVVLTPLTRVGSTVARHREQRRFEKLQTTPLTVQEWFLAHVAVTVGFILAASLLVSVLVVLLGGHLPLAPGVLVFVAVGTVLFCAIGAIVGALADSQDGVVAASNALGLPIVLLAETFVPPELLPAGVRLVVPVVPLTYFSRGIRATLAGDTLPALQDLGILVGITAVLVTVAIVLVPWQRRGLP